LKTLALKVGCKKVTKLLANIEGHLGKVSVFTLFAILLMVVIGLINLFFPEAIPYRFLDAWDSHGTTLREAIVFSWPIFAWAVGVTGTVAISTRNNWVENKYAESYLGDGIIASAVAGFFEEIIFRWLLFYTAIATIQFSNGIFFGWWPILQFGVPEWFYGNIMGPVINFFTFGLIDDIIINPMGWFIGAAVILTNKNFREGHKYLGPLGYINSWYIGFFLFYVMFTFGLFAAIIVHFIYDALIFSVAYVDRVTERVQGR
jgi:hypothetical protein